MSEAESWAFSHTLFGEMAQTGPEAADESPHPVISITLSV
jgi:hypothetical protein